MGGQHGRCDLTSTSRWHSRTQLQPSFDISLERMTGTVQKQEQGQNKSYKTDRFLPTKGSLISCFHVGKGKKRLYCVVLFTSAESYGFGKRVERKQKGPSPSDAFVMKQPPLYLPTSLPAPLYPSEQRAPTVMHIQRCCSPSTDTLRHIRRRSRYLQKTLTWSHALDNTCVSEARLGSQVEMRSGTRVQSRPRRRDSAGVREWFSAARQLPPRKSLIVLSLQNDSKMK